MGADCHSLQQLPQSSFQEVGSLVAKSYAGRLACAAWVWTGSARGQLIGHIAHKQAA